MTKKIRIENADTSNYKVRVHTEYLVDGVWVRSNDLIKPAISLLDYPTALTELYIHNAQRLVVEEGE